MMRGRAKEGELFKEVHRILTVEYLVKLRKENGEYHRQHPNNDPFLFVLFCCSRNPREGMGIPSVFRH